MRTATLTIAIDIDDEDPNDRPDSDWCKELLLDVVADISDQALMGYITVTEEET